MVFPKCLLLYLAFQCFQLSPLGLKKTLRSFKDLQVVILTVFCHLDASLQTLKPTEHNSTSATSEGARSSQLLQKAPPGPCQSSFTPIGLTHSSVSFPFFWFRHWKSASLAATTLFISFKISSCLILCCSKSSASAWSNLQQNIYPPGPSGLACMNLEPLSVSSPGSTHLGCPSSTHLSCCSAFTRLSAVSWALFSKASASDSVCNKFLLASVNFSTAFFV